MKRSTCKVLLGIAGLIILLILILSIDYKKNSCFFEIITKTPCSEPSLGSLFIQNPLSWIAMILIIFAWAKWNSEEEYKDIKEAQLHALRRGKVSVELKGKMKKLK